MNDTTNPARRLRHGDRPTAPLRWNDRWTLLLTGPHHGLIGPLGSTWPDQSTEYERVDVCALPTGARVFPDRDPNKPAEEQGLFNKFIVMRTDGKDAPGEKHHGCAYFVLDLDHDRHAPAAMRAYASACSETHPALAADLVAKFGKPKLDDSEQYRLQMAAIGTASFGYWKEGDTIHPDYDTVPLRDVARLYAKYEALHAFHSGVRTMINMLKNREWAEDLGAHGDLAELQGLITELVGQAGQAQVSYRAPAQPTPESGASLVDRLNVWPMLVQRFANGRPICNCRRAYLSPCKSGYVNGEKRDDILGCKYGCEANQNSAQQEIAERLIYGPRPAEGTAAPDAVDAAFADAVVHGTGAFQVKPDGSTVHVDLQRDALHPDYAVPKPEGGPK